MNYSIVNLTLVADCDFLITMANREKADLDLKKHVDEHSTEKFSDTSVELDAIYEDVVSELAAVEERLLTMPVGKARTNAEKKQKTLTARKLILETRQASYGTVALLMKEMELARVQDEIAQVEAFILAVKQRKTTLEAQA